LFILRKLCDIFKKIEWRVVISVNDILFFLIDKLIENEI